MKFATQKELVTADPYNTFDWLMDVSEENNLQSAFYFICGRTDATHDADYELEHQLSATFYGISMIVGTEIGLHPSYNTYKNPSALRQEAELLKRVCAEEGIQQKHWGGRMHYLRWQRP